MRPRIALTIVLCLLAVSTVLPVSAGERDREGGRTSLDSVGYWSALSAWISQFGLILSGEEVDEEGGSVATLPKPEVTQPGDTPNIGLDADPNG